MTISTWLSELTSAATPVEGFTTQEAVKILGVGTARVRQLLRQWLEDGKIVHAGWRTSTRLDGRPCQIPVYQVTKKGRKK